MGTSQLILMQVLNAGVIIGILMLIAIGLGVIYGLMDVLNLAHGEFLMLGGYGVVVGQGIGLATWQAMILATVLVGLFGFLLERGLIRHLYKRPLDSLLATWGISLILVQTIRLVFGPAPQTVVSPLQGALSIGGLPFPKYQVFVLCFSVLLTVAVLAVLRYPTFGLRTRAVFQDAEMARSLGIRAPRIYSMWFAIGAALAGLAGALIAPIVTVAPTMGGVFLVRAFLTVIVGGVGNLAGVMGGAGVIGGSEGVIAYFSSGIMAQVFVLAIAICIVRLRPKGIFVRK
jgi:urea ABC transporter permease protein UrtB